MALSLEDLATLIKSQTRAVDQMTSQMLDLGVSLGRVERAVEAIHLLAVQVCGTNIRSCDAGSRLEGASYADTLVENPLRRSRAPDYWSVSGTSNSFD